MPPSDGDGSVHVDGVGVSLPPACVCGFVAPAVSEDAWTRRRAWLKNNIPSVISLLSVVLNIVILSALIPQMKQDISYVQGQSNAIQSQINTVQLLLSALNEQTRDAQAAVAVFNSEAVTIQQQFNATRTDLASFTADAQQQIDAMQNATQTLSSDFERDMSRAQRTINESRSIFDSLVLEFDAVQAGVAVCVQQLRNATDTAVAEVRAYNATVRSEMDAVVDSYSERMAQFNSTVRDQWAVAVQAYDASLAAYNATAILARQDANIHAIDSNLTARAVAVANSLVPLQSFQSTFQATTVSALPVVTTTGGGAVTYTSRYAAQLRHGQLVTYIFNARGSVSGGSGNFRVSLPPGLPCDGSSRWHGISIFGFWGGSPLKTTALWQSVTSTQLALLDQSTGGEVVVVNGAFLFEGQITYWTPAS